MAELCLIGKIRPANELRPDLETHVMQLLNEKKLFTPGQLGSAHDGSSADAQAAYHMLSIITLAFKQYLAGSCEVSSEQLLHRVKSWNDSSINDNPFSLSAKQNLITILGQIKDPEVKQRAQVLLTLLQKHTPNIKAGETSPPIVPEMKTLADAAPVAAPRIAIASEVKDYTGVNAKEKLFSDAAIFGSELSTWNKPEVQNGRYYVVKKLVESLRLYLDGKGSEVELKQRIKNWEKHECFQDTFSRAVLVSLGMQLTVHAPQLKGEGAAFQARAAKAAGLLPLVAEAEQKPVLVDERAEPAKPARTNHSDLNNANIFEGNLQAFEKDQYGQHYKLSKFVDELRSYLAKEGATYTSLQAKLNTWVNSESYASDISKAARARLITVLSVWKNTEQDRALKGRLGTVLNLIEQSPVAQSSGAQTPEAPVVDHAAPALAEAKVASLNGKYEGRFTRVQSYSVEPVGHLEFARGSTDIQNQRLSVAMDTHAHFLAEQKLSFYFKATIHVSANRKGEVEKVEFTSVEAESYGKNRRPIPLDVLGVFMRQVANDYRREMSYPRGPGENSSDFKISLSPPDAPQHKIDRNVMIDFSERETDEVQAPAAVVKKSDEVRDFYEFDLSEMQAPQKSPTSAAEFTDILRSQAKQGSMGYAVELNGPFQIKALPTLEFDSKGYLTKVSFSSVKAEAGVDQGAQVQRALLLIAAEWRDVRYKADAKVVLGKQPSLFEARMEAP